MDQLKTWFDKAKRRPKIAGLLLIVGFLWHFAFVTAGQHAQDDALAGTLRAIGGFGAFVLIAYPVGMLMLVVFWPNFPTMNKESS